VNYLVFLILNKSI